MTDMRIRFDAMNRAVGNLASLSTDRIGADLDRLREQIGGLETRLAAALPPEAVTAAEFSVFSQFGEDGIIQHLLRHVPIENETFVEFGVEDYTESNTRFLLVHDNWRGLIIDGGDSHIEFARQSGLAWRQHLDTVQAFIDRDNIEGLIAGAGISGDIGILSVDIDGNDYWVLERIENVSPRILIVEYNSVFGPTAPITVPYDPGFQRSQAHWSHLYWGVSIAAITHLANRKGYALVAGNKAGNNVFYVRRDLLGPLRELTPEEAYVESRFRESRDPSGNLSYVSTHAERIELIGDLPVVDVVRDERTTVRQAVAGRQSS
jgi:hypothetical protein